jgi:hypothetical protein
MSDPFEILEPTVISFSGGRTSAYMLWRILQSNEGKLPNEAIVVFANTGKEEEATLKFVQDCGKNWNVPIHWVEYAWNEDAKLRFKKVNFESASRNGEPFMEMIHESTGYLPNPVGRICTAQLKIRTIDKYLKSLGWKHNENMDWVGIRADEMRRAAKMDRERTPLVTAGVTKQTVGDFWKEQLFDLGLPNMNGVTMHGNCDLCFLKPTHQIISLIREKPSRADWWIKAEMSGQTSNKTFGDGGRFRKDRPSYSDLKAFALSHDDMFPTDEEGIPCFCGD